jgi:4'-phosphopantetheinyl transferase
MIRAAIRGHGHRSDRSEDAPVSVWRVRLDRDEQSVRALGRHLSADEMERYERLRDSAVGRRWLVSRAVLREVLAAELGVSPAAVRLQVGPHSRPGLDPAAHQCGLDFNLSHSGELALVATARGMRVGVDVERLRRGRNPLRIADRFFSPAEVEAVRAVPPPDRPWAFFRYWTAKEALAKGLGLGLQAPSAELELAQQPGGTMVPVRLAGDWRVVELADLPRGYCGALAVDDSGARIMVRDWPDHDA